MRAFAHLVQRQAERRLRVPSAYLGRMGEAAFAGFLKFLMFLPVAGHRRRSTPAVVHAARIVATQHEDCGPCVQVAVNQALDDGVEPRVVRAVLDRDHQQLPAEVALAVRFAEGVVAADGSEASSRSEIVALLGETVVIELSLAVATARVFPTVKRGMGLARSCALVQVEVPASDASPHRAASEPGSADRAPDRRPR